MKKGYLSQYFDGVAIKTLSAVEADRTRSNQHEYNATREMLDFMRRPCDKTPIDARFLYLNDDDAEPIPEDAFLTLYDSRKGQPHRSPEYRFYFPTTNVSNNACEGDLLTIAKRHDGGLLVIIAERDSTIARQIRWLFGLTDAAHPGFSVKSEMETEQDRIGFAARGLLDIWLFSGNNLADSLRHAYDMWRGQHLTSELARRITFNSLRIEGGDTFMIQTDGEPRGSAQVAEIKVQARALRLLTPPGAMDLLINK